MARKMLVGKGANTTQVVLDAPRVTEHRVEGSRGLVTYDVQGPQTEDGKRRFAEDAFSECKGGAIVRLRPGEGCTSSDLDTVEAGARRGGAAAVHRMPLQSHEQVLAEQEQVQAIAGVTIRGAFGESLSRVLKRDGASESEATSTCALAMGMLEKAGG